MSKTKMVLSHCICRVVRLHTRTFTEKHIRTFTEKCNRINSKLHNRASVRLHKRMLVRLCEHADGYLSRCVNLQLCGCV